MPSTDSGDSGDGSTLAATGDGGGDTPTATGGNTPSVEGSSENDDGVTPQLANPNHTSGTGPVSDTAGANDQAGKVIVVKDTIKVAANTVYDAHGATFTAEKAIMVADIYRKNGEWRIASNLQGYNAGLDALVVHFGGEVADAPAPAPAAPPRISLEKKIADAAPQLISLAKKAQVSLEKARLTDTKARVGLVLDASGSMNPQYTRGHVQEVVDRLIPLAVHFDDDGALDCWAFGAKPQQLNAVTLSNFQNFIRTDHGGWKDWELGARINDEPKAMRMVIDYYKKSGDKTPVYILFISDGGVHQDREITRLMTEAAKLPIFWQFVGLGGRGYGILEKLDDMGGRVVDNCNFFALDRLDEIPEEKLYDLLMEEFPDWLKAAKGAGIL
ncbi:putative Tellurium resistance protein [Pseudomonas savastanoi pv. glycinea]|nr:putative Tellurium resistance protein [Pseudomonas savastanoi pv. glycinea]